MKKFIKNNLKVFVTMVITTIIVGSVSVYAASQYFAKDITFTPTNDNFKKENGEPIDNVEDALNELYDQIGNQRNYLIVDTNTTILKNVKITGHKINATLQKIDTISWYNTNLKFTVEPGDYKFTITGSTYGRFVFSPVNQYTSSIFDGNIYKMGYKQSELIINFTKSQTLYLWFSNDTDFDNRSQCNIEIGVTKI